MNFKTFKNYVENANPLPWTIIKEHSNSLLIGNNSLNMNLIRYFLIVKKISEHLNSNEKINILDVGVYPGVTAKLIKELNFNFKLEKYFGLGLGFDEGFKKYMKKIDVELINCDFDPRINFNKNRSSKFIIDDNQIDLVIFTDVIEHLYDPTFVLKEINRVTKKNSMMILTTDNISRFVNLKSILKGKSSNIPLLESNIFYNGDWRPHFREYAKNELEKMLEWSGFKVMHHEYYQAKFGNFILQSKKLVKIKNQKQSIKRRAFNLIEKILVSLFPHFKDNQILIAQKIIDYNEMITNSPHLTNDVSEWVEQRKEFRY